MLKHPERRDEFVRSLTAQLGLAEYNDEVLNGLLISYSLDLRAVESRNAITAAYVCNDVDEQICGDLEEVLDQLSAPMEPERES